MDNKSFYVENWCTTSLLKIGVPINLTGFKYLKSAITKAFQDEKMISSYTKRLYPALANEYNVNVSVVERGIRNAIEVATNRRNSVGINELFGFEVFDYSYKPSNSELIGLLVEKLNLDSQNMAF